MIKETKLQLADASYEPSRKDEKEVNFMKQHILFQDEQLRTFKAKIEELSE